LEDHQKTSNFGESRINGGGASYDDILMNVKSSITIELF
jgi:hypothetical protein